MASRDPNYEPEEDEGRDSEPTMVGEEKTLSGPINVQEAQEYVKVLNNILDNFNVAENAEERDALRTTLHVLKKHITKRWDAMVDVDVDKVLSSIKERSCDTLWETLGEHVVTLVDPEEETPSGP